MDFLLIGLGLLVGALGALAGVGGGIVLVPALIFLGFSHKAAVSTSFLNMFFLVLASLLFFGIKGAVDWKTGFLLGLGSVAGVYLTANYIQPLISERQFRYFFAALIVLVAISLVWKK